MKKRKTKSNKKSTSVNNFKRVFSKWCGLVFFWLPKNRWLRIPIITILLAIGLFITGSYAIAQWYIYGNRNEPIRYGVTFIPEYAESLGVEPKATMQAIIDELGVRNFRLVSYWDQIEATPGIYDFSKLDWQFKKAEASDSKISLAIGLRQPRWPECHEPTWAKGKPVFDFYPQLTNYMTAVINRYKNNPALESYQLENEFFLSVFGECTDFTRSRLVDEYNLVKKLDPHHQIIISRSNNIIGVPVNEPIPDISAVSVYKRVWDKDYTHRYVEYPFPAWFYATLAGTGKIINGKDLVIHELQSEPWLPRGYDMRTAPISEQNKSLSPARLTSRMEYGRATGIKYIDVWGVEWMYARKINFNQPDVWDTLKTQLKIQN